MRQFSYAVTRHSVMIRTLFILAVMAAVAIAIASPEVAQAGPDGFGP